MPAFGYSVGDCIASVDLLVRILKSLRETGGASSEFQQLQADLDFLGEVLEQLNIVDLVSANTSANQTAKAAKFVQASQATLLALLDKVSKFKESLAVGATSGKFPSAFRKAQWALMYSEDVAKLRQLLASQTASLTLFLEAQNIGCTKALALDLSMSQNQAASATASQASSLHRLQASISGLSHTVKNRLHTWENNQRLQYSEMIRKLAEVEDNTRTHVSSGYEDHRSALTRCAEDTMTQGNRHQQALQLVAASVEEQKSLLGLEFGRLHGSIDATNEEMASLSQILQSSTKALEEVTRDLRQHQEHQRLRLVKDKRLGEHSLDSEYKEASSRISSSDACRTNRRLNLVMNNIGAFIADWSSSIIVGIWVLLCAILRTVIIRFQGLGKLITLYKYPKLVITDCIQLFDALGRVQLLQYDICRNWELFTAILHSQFKHLPGYRKVQMGEFVLLDLRSKMILPKQDEWSRSIFPGSKIAMSMLMTELEITKGKCPRPLCGASVKVKPGQVTVKCLECELNFFPVKKISLGVSLESGKRRKLMRYALGNSVIQENISLGGLEMGTKRMWGSKEFTLSVSQRFKTVRIRDERRKALEIEELSFYRRIHIAEALPPSDETRGDPVTSTRPKRKGYQRVSQEKYFPRGLWPQADVRCPVCDFERCSSCWGPGDLYRWNSVVPAGMWVCCDCHV